MSMANRGGDSGDVKVKPVGEETSEILFFFFFLIYLHLTVGFKIEADFQILHSKTNIKLYP